ncbi:hypothetical protein [Idiomarina abyssalis]|uniref:hypothetical protein n=1 Tax=Idiomarina abyssalis TaxID=86102 RepID=UPI003A946C07
MSMFLQKHGPSIFLASIPLALAYFSYGIYQAEQKDVLDTITGLAALIYAHAFLLFFMVIVYHHKRIERFLDPLH